MKLLWTKSTKPLSIFIRFLTGNDCSHFSFVLYENSVGPIVFEANLLGTHPTFLQTSMKSHTVVHEKEVPRSQEIEDRVMDLIISTYDGKDYDFLGALYLGYRSFLYRWFKIPIPDINKWSKDGTYFCDVLYQILIIAGLPPIKDIKMKTPHDVWMIVKDWQINS